MKSIKSYIKLFILIIILILIVLGVNACKRGLYYGFDYLYTNYDFLKSDYEKYSTPLKSNSEEANKLMIKNSIVKNNPLYYIGIIDNNSDERTKRLSDEYLKSIEVFKEYSYSKKYSCFADSLDTSDFRDKTGILFPFKQYNGIYFKINKKDPPRGIVEEAKDEYNNTNFGYTNLEVVRDKDKKATSFSYIRYSWESGITEKSMDDDLPLYKSLEFYNFRSLFITEPLDDTQFKAYLKKAIETNNEDDEIYVNNLGDYIEIINIKNKIIEYTLRTYK